MSTHDLHDGPLPLDNGLESLNNQLLIRLTPAAALAYGTEPEFYGRISMISLEFDEIEQSGGSKYEILMEHRKLLVNRNEIISIDGISVHDFLSSGTESE